MKDAHTRFGISEDGKDLQLWHSPQSTRSGLLPSTSRLLIDKIHLNIVQVQLIQIDLSCWVT